MYWSIQVILCSQNVEKSLSFCNSENHCWSEFETSRNGSAFNRLFESTLSKNLSDHQCVYLLNFVGDAGHLSGDGAVLKEMKVDDYEHALCEWVKASRGRDAFVGKSSSKKQRLAFGRHV